MKIIVDAMGGDLAPTAIVKGAVMAVEKLNVEVVLVGKGEEILKVLHSEGHKELPKGVEIAHAPDVIEMEDSPMAVMKAKKDSSMTVAMRMLNEGAGDVMISAGSTAALLTAATLTVKRIKGIRRAVLAPAVINAKGQMILIDSGANSDCTPEYLLQFAFMGSYYARQVLNIPDPRVGLLNIGAEENKGTSLQQEAYKLLMQAHREERINFVGNVEGRDAVEGAVDVVVTDGFSGNIMLKTMEGTAMFFAKEIKGMFKKNLLSKLSYLLVRKSVDNLKKKMDYREVGGTALLGISKPVIKAHGSSDEIAILGAVKQAIAFCNSGVIEDIQENIGFMRLGTGEKDK